MSDPVSPAFFDADGRLRSHRHGDVYFSREGGLAEARAVFLAGCGLPDRWSARRRFTVGELGFGTGLNIVALLDLWRRAGPPEGRLSIFSVEAQPVPQADARRALAAWPEVGDLADRLLARWPGRRAGFQRIEFPELRASLDLAVMDAAAALGEWQGAADAWFLDGFAPAVNPEMWSDELMRLVARRSRPGARAGTYTVAGQARRALAAAGFEVARRPGFGAKRQRLEATLAGAPPSEPELRPRVVIIGAGVAGAALARAFGNAGVNARVLDAAGAGAGASGNPAALVTPRLDAGLGPVARLHAQAFHHACGLYERLAGAVIAESVMQLETQERDAARFAKIAASDLFEPGALTPIPADAATARLGEAASAALALSAALVIDPAVVLAAWLPSVERAAVGQIREAGASWRLFDPSGAALGEAEIVCLALGSALSGVWPDAPVSPVRGQLSWIAGAPAPPAVAWGAYVAPTRDGVMFGATHDRDDAASDRRDRDDARNLAAVAARLPGLAARLAARPVQARASVRAVTRDRLPIAGQLRPGLLVLGGLGARGFALAPLLAEHLAATALGTPSPLPRQLAAAVRPDRLAVAGPDARAAAAP